jgi:hypothetical protein
MICGDCALQAVLTKTAVAIVAMTRIGFTLPPGQTRNLRLMNMKSRSAFLLVDLFYSFCENPCPLYRQPAIVGNRFSIRRPEKGRSSPASDAAGNRV